MLMKEIVSKLSDQLIIGSWKNKFLDFTRNRMDELSYLVIL
jgi:hypothetical protein